MLLKAQFITKIQISWKKTVFRTKLSSPNNSCMPQKGFIHIFQIFSIKKAIMLKHINFIQILKINHHTLIAISYSCPLTNLQYDFGLVKTT